MTANLHCCTPTLLQICMYANISISTSKPLILLKVCIRMCQWWSKHQSAYMSAEAFIYYILTAHIIMHLSGLLRGRGRKWGTRPVCRTDLTHARSILYDAVRWWSDNTKLLGHPTIRYLWTCHHSALLRTCTLVNLSSVICCHYLMTMALACFQATQRHQAIVCLNQGGDLQYMRVQYGIWTWSMKKKARCPTCQLYPDNKGKKQWQMQAFASRPTLHLGHANLERNRGNKKKKTASNKTIFKAVI